MEKQRIVYIGTTQLPTKDFVPLPTNVPTPTQPVTTRTPPTTTTQPQKPSVWDEILGALPVLANIAEPFIGRNQPQQNPAQNTQQNAGFAPNQNQRQSQDNTLLYVGLAVAGAFVFKSMKKKKK